MKNIKFVFNLILITLAQTMLCPYIKIGSIIPDLIFIFLIIMAQKEKNLISVMVKAAACGAVMDCLSGRIFGNYVSVYLVAAVIIYLINESVFKSNIIINLTSFFLINMFTKSLFFLLNISVLKDVGFLYSFVFIILPEALYNLVICFLYHIVINRKSFRKAGGL